MTFHGQPFLGKQSISQATSDSGAVTFTAIDPRTGEALPGAFLEATEAYCDHALQLAQAAHRALKSVTRDQRADFLLRIADEIEALGEPLFERTSLETGLPLARLMGERGRTMGQLRMFAAHVRDGSYLDARIEQAEPDRLPIPKPDLRLTHRPLGPVVVFGASNFPLAFSTAGGDTASALAAGCPVVVKAHPAHPGCAELVATAIVRAVAACDMPEGTFTMVHGTSQDVGRWLVEHPLTKAVGFTGSLAGGRALFDLAARRKEPIPVFAEMGSINPLFLLPGKMAESGAEMAKGLSASITLGVGQFCTCPGLAVVMRDGATDGFLTDLATAVGETAAGTMLHPGIRKAWHAGVEAAMAVPGVAVVGRSAALEDGPASAAPIALSCSGSTFLAHPVLGEEVFGPSTLVVLCEDQQEMSRVAEGLVGQLSVAVHATEADLRAHDGLLAILEDKAGRILMGGYPTGVEVCAAMHHGGPYPATTDSRTTSVGSNAILRFVRPVCYQSFAQSELPAELRD